MDEDFTQLLVEEIADDEAEKDEFFDGLNPQQREAVQHTEGPLWVVAGAGSGKTKVLTHRVAYLIKYLEVGHDRVLAITFTNKAANEMKDRIFRFTGVPTWKMWVSTFHSACVRILRKEADKLLFTDGPSYKKTFTIYDQDDSVRMTRRVMGLMDIDRNDYNPRAAHGFISKIKNMLLWSNIDGYYDEQEVYQLLGREGAAQEWREIVPSLLSRYQLEMRRSSVMDFDDLLVNTVRLFQQNLSVLRHYQNQFQYVLVDEFQDTNLIQYLLTRQIALGNPPELGGSQRSDPAWSAGDDNEQASTDTSIVPSRLADTWDDDQPVGFGNLAVVGDIDQSIYAFRGARIENLRNFELDFPNPKVIKLEQNYRSTSNILDAANEVISANPHAFRKELWSDLGLGKKLTWYQAIDDRDEARFVVSEIAKLSHEYDLSDITVLYRTNAQSRIFEEFLTSQNIPYRIVGSLRFWDRKEIKDVMSYLRFLLNQDEVSLSRIINNPTRKIGGVTLAGLSVITRDRSVLRWEVIDSIYKGVEHSRVLKSHSRRALIGFADIVNRLMAHLFDSILFNQPDFLAEFVELVLCESNYRSMLEKNNTIEDRGRLENLEQLVDVAAEFDRSKGGIDVDDAEWDQMTGEQKLGLFVDKYSLTNDADELDDTNQVQGSGDEDQLTLMTVHTVKGLEYPVVFMVGMEEGIFPHSMSLNEEAQMSYLALAKKEAQKRGNYDSEDNFDYEAAVAKPIQEERRLAYVGITRAQERLFFTSTKQRMQWGQFDNQRIPSRFLLDIPEELIEVKRSKQHALRRRGPRPFAQANLSNSLVGTGNGRSTTPAQSSPTPPSPSSVEFKAGDRIKHVSWGLGVIHSLSGSGNRVQADVLFESVGRKKLLIAYAPVERID